MNGQLSTAEKVLQAIGYSKLRRRGKQYRGNSPFRSDSDSQAFTLTINDPEHGAYADHVSGETGSLYDLAKRLGISPNGAGDEPEVAPAVYHDLADYARQHGVEADVFAKAGWLDTEYQGRKTIAFSTANGTRYRFLDGEKPKFINEPGYGACWYGLGKAVMVAGVSNSPLVICNGEPSVVVSQFYGLPACAVTSGEKRLSPEHLKQLQDVWNGQVWICLDCDATGRRVAYDLAKQLPHALVIDLGLGQSGDLADFCALHGDDSFNQLRAIVIRSQPPPAYQTTSLADTVSAYHKMQDMGYVAPGKPILIPFKTFHHLGGFAKVLMPGKIAGIVAPSSHGKTSFLETWTDCFLQDGERGVWFGPEWTPREYQQRRVQRLGGASYQQVNEYELWKKERAAGIPEAQRKGTLLDSDLEVRSFHFNQFVKSWPGSIAYFHSRPGQTLENVLANMTDFVTRQREQGLQVTFAVFDYAQLLKVRDVADGSNRHETAIEEVKHWTIEMEIVSFIGSQVRKDETKQLKRANKIIDSDGALYLRDDKFNLFITLNSQYEQDIVDQHFIRTNRAIANVTKNSVGQTGEVKLLSDLSNLKWIDQAWSL